MPGPAGGKCIFFKKEKVPWLRTQFLRPSLHLLGFKDTAWLKCTTTSCTFIYLDNGAITVSPPC